MHGGWAFAHGAWLRSSEAETWPVSQQAQHHEKHQGTVQYGLDDLDPCVAVVRCNL